MDKVDRDNRIHAPLAHPLDEMAQIPVVRRAGFLCACQGAEGGPGRFGHCCLIGQVVDAPAETVDERCTVRVHPTQQLTSKIEASPFGGEGGIGGAIGGREGGSASCQCRRYTEACLAERQDRASNHSCAARNLVSLPRYHPDPSGI